MLNQNLRIQELTSLGLSLNEAKTYLALLIKKDMTINEIAQVSGVPRAKVYGVIKKLVKRGFCIEKAGDIKKCRAVDPQIVVKKLNELYQQQINQRQSFAKSFASSVGSLYKQNIDKNDPLEYIEILKDRGQIKGRIIDLVENAKDSIYAFTKAPYTSLYNKDIDDRVDVLKRSVKIQSIYEYRDLMYQDVISKMSSWIGAGEEARVVEELPIKMVIFDEKITICALNDPISLKPSLTTMMINHVGFARAQKKMFESYWEKAITIDEYKNKKNTED